jgi:hypothetical protein
MKMVLDVLALQGDIEWARCGGRMEPLRSPFVAWRYKLPTEMTEQRIVEAVRCYAGPVRWIVDKGERNWAIQLDAFRTFARNFIATVRHLSASGRSFRRKQGGARRCRGAR